MLCSVCNKDLDGEHWRCVRCSCTGCGETPRARTDRQLCQWCVDDLEGRGERRCRACNVIKPLDVFGTRKGVPYLYCRDCVAAKNAAEYQRAQEHRKAYNRTYYQENKERIQVHRAHYRHENWEKELVAQRRRRARRHEAARATAARYMRSYRLRPGVKARERVLKRNARVRKKLKVLEEIRGKR
jgi:hypothetical protein